MSTASHSVEMLRAMSLARKTVASIRPLDPDTAQRTELVLEQVDAALHQGGRPLAEWSAAYLTLLEQTAPAKRALVRVLLKQIDQAFTDAAAADSPL